MSQKIRRVLGKKGCITIPYAIRVAHGIQYNDALSFEDTGDGAIILRKERLCDPCVPESHRQQRSDEHSLKTLIDSLSDEQKRKVCLYLNLLLADKEGMMRCD